MNPVPAQAPRAVILAAGRGTRLGPLTETRPKSLLEVGGASLLFHSLSCLHAAGIQDILVVTGHEGAQIRRALESRRDPNACDPQTVARFSTVQTIEAPAYVERGSMGSLLTAAELQTFVTADTSALLVLESDLLYARGFLEAALAATHSTILTAPLSGSGDEVYVTVGDGGQLIGMTKHADPQARAAAVGEFAGISLLTLDCLDRYRVRARQWLEDGRKDAHYEEVLIALARDGLPLYVRHCAGLPWTEVDNAADLARAREQIWPLLAAER